MKAFAAILVITLVSSLGFASDTYCNGKTEQSGSYRYYPNGKSINSGSYRYYPNGKSINSGSYRYYPNGKSINSGSYWYYANGKSINSGSYRYYPNGKSINSGSTCYYENGKTMGSCPDFVTVKQLVDGYMITLKVYINGDQVLGDQMKIKFGGEDYRASFSVSLDSAEVSNVETVCDASDSTRADEIISKYNLSSSSVKEAVKAAICQ